MDTATKQLIDCLKKMTRLIKRNKPAMPFDDGIKKMTLGQLDVIRYLCEHKKARMSDIAKEAGVKLPTMTDIVDKLVKEGVVERQRQKDDRRTVLISISPKIKEQAERIMKKHDFYIEKILSVLSKKEKLQAIKIITKINDSMKEGVQ